MSYQRLGNGAVIERTSWCDRIAGFFTVTSDVSNEPDDIVKTIGGIHQLLRQLPNVINEQTRHINTANVQIKTLLNLDNRDGAEAAMRRKLRYKSHREKCYRYQDFLEDALLAIQDAKLLNSMASVMQSTSVSLDAFVKNFDEDVLQKLMNNIHEQKREIEDTNMILSYTDDGYSMEASIELDKYLEDMDKHESDRMIDRLPEPAALFDSELVNSNDNANNNNGIDRARDQSGLTSVINDNNKDGTEILAKSGKRKQVHET